LEFIFFYSPLPTKVGRKKSNLPLLSPPPPKGRGRKYGRILPLPTYVGGGRIPLFFSPLPSGKGRD